MGFGIGCKFTENFLLLNIVNKQKMRLQNELLFL